MMDALQPSFVDCGMPYLTLRRIAAGLALVLLASCSSAERPARFFPAPTEIVGSEEKEGESRRAREEWEELLHSAPPGVSWRAIEVENRRRNLEARAARIEGGFADEPLGTWRERGSFDQTGRNHVTTVGSDGKTLFVGSNLGGVFSGLPGGRRWVARSDGLGIGIYSFVVVPGKPEVWIAASETTPLYVSTNRGVTWSEAEGGPPAAEWAVRILRDRSQARTVYALTSAGLMYKLYRSDDGGITFAVVSSGQNAGLPDLWIDRVRGGPLYLALQQEIRKSTDGGVTFKRVGRLPVTAQTVKLVGSEAGAPTFYALIRPPRGSSWSLFVSENAGRSWRAGSALPFFWGGFNASITNPKLLFFGGVNGYRSTDAGRTLQPINEWFEYYDSPDTKLHGDVMGIDCVLYRGKEVVFFNTDGGTFISENGGRTVRNITRYGLGNAQYYSILTSANDSRRIAAGSQDQGYQVSRPSGRAVLGFDQLASGDYGSLTSSDGTHNRLYSSYPGFILIQVREGENVTEGINFPVPPDERAQGWIAPLVADPEDPNVVFYGDRRIWRMERQESGDYTSEVLPHDFSEEQGYVTSFAISPADRNRWYAATSAGRLWSSTDGGTTWALGRDVDFFIPTDVLPSPTDPEVCYVSGGGYGDGISVYRTTDGGATWHPHAEGLPKTLVRALAFDDPARQTLYAATQAGPFRYDEASASWVNLLGTQAPLTLYTDVEGVPAEAVVRFATYGRGIWDFSPR
jgi:photosystem II stability/assembly factor-like uncharacterized protein